MKRRTNGALNFFALCLLLFAGYLNFFKKDKESSVGIIKNTAVAPSKNTVLVSNPEHYFKTNAKSRVAQPPVARN